ncbi:hypothetical protein [Caballeronia concitans]|uniref:Uncharacterized protein n=1 Tax=Caballeronia concitans TaxID=1777133 RepID=A0A658R611_9BURK|nr:hypothetical protein [Caballeronia concitans]SAL52444.1 hypothetical protein AWB72_05585 [Caballeronia concitans]
MQGAFDSNMSNTPALTSTGTNGAIAVQATSDGTSVIEAYSNARTALVGATDSGIGLYAQASSKTYGIGVRAQAEGGWGINATSETGVAVLGQSTTDVGIFGQSLGNSFGVVGNAPNAGVAAFNPNNNHAAYLASGCCAAWFTGDVHVAGTFSKAGGGFKIDHPLDPEGRYLQHSFVESPDMKNVYDGIVTADARGEATISLPDYFETLNRECRYQLTAIGGAAPELHVAHEIRNNRFSIAGATPGMRVSWQVTGIRNDPWAKVNCIEVELPKQKDEHGFYLHPELHGHGPDRAIGELRHPRVARSTG